jgi:hypothetical protein
VAIKLFSSDDSAFGLACTLLKDFRTIFGPNADSSADFSPNKQLTLHSDWLGGGRWSEMRRCHTATGR